MPDRAPQLNKEKDQRRAWAAHKAQQEIFDVQSSEFEQLKGLSDKLDICCTEPSRTGVTDPHKEKKSRRKQLVELRNELRATLSNVDKKLEADEAEEPDELLEKAYAEARERSKRPPHLRGAALLKETLGCA